MKSLLNFSFSYSYVMIVLLMNEENILNKIKYKEILLDQFDIIFRYLVDRSGTFLFFPPIQKQYFRYLQVGIAYILAGLGMI